MSEPALLAHLGVAESGKTYALQRCARTEMIENPGRRFLVIDPNHEWPGVCRVERFATVRNVESAKLALANAERLVVVRCSDESELPDVGRDCAQLAWDLGLWLTISEAQLVIPERGPPTGPWLRIVTGWRHRGAGVWIDTTRPALVSKSMLDVCRRWRVFQLTATDRKWARELGGLPLVDAIMFCGRKLAPKEEGGDDEPGWHVELSPRTLLPPFKPKRFPAAPAQ